MATQNVTDSYVIPQAAGDTYNGDSSDQKYSINPALVGAGDTITIIDQGGNNTVELPAGLEITSSKVVANQTIINLSNGAVIDIRSADNFNFDIGKNLASGDNRGATQSFDGFVKNVLGTNIPNSGEGVAEGGASTINNDGTASSVTVINEDLTAIDGKAETFQYNIDSSTGDAVSLAGDDFTVENFNPEEDSIIFNDVESGTLTETNFGGSSPTVSASFIDETTDFIFAENSKGNAYQLTLKGVADQDIQKIDFSVAGSGDGEPESIPDPEEGENNGNTFTFDVEKARTLEENTQDEITDFNPDTDSLEFNLAAGNEGDYTLNELYGIDSVIVQNNPFDGGSTLITFGPDDDGDLIALELTGVTDSTQVDVVVL